MIAVTRSARFFRTVRSAVWSAAIRRSGQSGEVRGECRRCFLTGQEKGRGQGSLPTAYRDCGGNGALLENRAAATGAEGAGSMAAREARTGPSGPVLADACECITFQVRWVALFT